MTIPLQLEEFTEERRHTRRQFCTYTCQAVSVLAAGTLTACGHGSPSSPGSVSVAQLPNVSGSVAGRTITVTVDAASPVVNVGSAAMLQTSLGRILIAHTAASAFTAVTATCTHDACTITGFEDAEYVCPCHGSRFATSGAVLNGPAQRALQQFATTFDGTVLTVSV